MARAVVDDDDRSTKALTTAPAGAARDASEDTSDGTTDEIARLRSEIVLRRRRLDSALQRLEHRVSEDLDWRRRVAAHPWMVMAAAALAGFAIGRLTGGPPTADRAREVQPS